MTCCEDNELLCYKDLLFKNLLDHPEYQTPVAEKIINEIKILDLRYTEEIDITFMTSHYAAIKFGKKFNPNNGQQILAIIAPSFGYGGIIDKEGYILLTEDLTQKIEEQATIIQENKLISDSSKFEEHENNKPTNPPPCTGVLPILPDTK